MNIQETVHPYYTHQQALVKYTLLATKGDIIVELGCGIGSTPILSEICQSLGLIYQVFYSDKEWQRQIEPMVECVQWNYVSDWDKFKLDKEVHLVLLDQEELIVNRAKHIERYLVNLAKYVIVHDADTYEKRGISLEKYNPYIYDKLIPHTAVLDFSKKIRIPELSQPKESKIERKSNTAESSEGNTAVVCCYQPGGWLDEHYIDYITHLRDGIKNNTTNADFYCVTTMNLDIDGVNVIYPINHWKGWHIKAEIFRTELWDDYDRVLYIDLDVVIQKNIDDILKSDERLIMIRDFYRPESWDTAMFFYCPRDFYGLYDYFLKLKPRYPYHKDADIISNFIKKIGLQPSFFQDLFDVASYKAHLVYGNKYHMAYQIVIFHGMPRPHDVNWDTSKKVKIAGPMPLSLRQNNDNPVPYQKKAGPFANLVNKRAESNKLRQVIEVEELWKDEDVFIIGGGPSLTNIDLNKLLKDYKVLGINDGYRFECCDICYFGDTVWYKHHEDELIKWGKPVYSTAGIHNKNIKFLNTQPNGLSKERNTLGWNSNSGFAGLNLCLHLGAKRIFMLGFDMDFDKNGQSNWHKNIRKIHIGSYNVFLRNEKFINADYQRYFSDREIYVVTTPNYNSRITIFPQLELQDLLGVDTKTLYKEV